MCHTRNCPIFFHYCINGLYLATILGFKFSTNIAVLDTSDNHPETAFCPVGCIPLVMQVSFVV
jgi:hypothetical protein